MPKARPRYLDLAASGELAARALAARELLSDCRLCPRACGVNRQNGETGVCGVGLTARVAHHGLHHGEEACISGHRGSGTVFFAGCNLRCVFCQNQDISRASSPDQEVGPEDLAAMMLDLAAQGAHNINLVTPSHLGPQILEALVLAAASGLDIPLVYNTSAYDSPQTLALFDGVADIYMPDTKFWRPEVADRLARAPDYPEAARLAIATMHRQVGDLVLDHEGVAVKGLLARHLVLPGGLSDPAEWMGFLAGLSPGTYVNIMDQYRPCGEAARLPVMGKSLSGQDFHKARQAACVAGLTRLEGRHDDVFAKLTRAMSGHD